MTHRLATNYAKNYCNRTLTVKVIVENVVTCFFGTQCRSQYTILHFIMYHQTQMYILFGKHLVSSKNDM